MLLFVSGRCDIPAFYSSWLMKRFAEGLVDVRNPYDPHQISRIYLNEETIDAIIFCTKNPLPLLPKLDHIPFPYLFHVTLTPYHQDIEKHLPDKSAILEGILALSQRISAQRVIVRYDPILLNDRYTIAYHAAAFEKLCKALQGKVAKIIISFLDMYKNTREHATPLGLHTLSETEMREVGKVLGEIAYRYHIPLQTCAEKIDLRSYHIAQGLCMDRKEIEQLIGYPLQVSGKGVRSQCQCLPSVDIGDYNLCAHGCAYCYANYDEDMITSRMQLHDPNSTVLFGHIEAQDRMTIRKEKPRQLTLL